jgi:hypothetical protein
MASKIKQMIVGLILITCVYALPAQAVKELTGKLTTTNNKSITVNDQKVKSGADISSGSDIRSPEKIGATIELGELGRLEIGPRTDLRLGFDAKGIIVHVRTGHVVLTTNKGFHGTLTTSDSGPMRTDSSKVSSIEAKTKDAVASQPVGAGSGIAARE